MICNEHFLQAKASSEKSQNSKFFFLLRSFRNQFLAKKNKILPLSFFSRTLGVIELKIFL